jgi:hypothetical protein
MKKLKALLLIFMTGNCSIIYGQQDTTNNTKNFIYKDFKIEKIQFLIKTDILSIIISAIEGKTAASFTGEICFNHRHSIQFTGLNKAYSTISRKDFTVEIIPEYKFFIEKRKSYSGFYAGAYLKTTNYSYENELNIDVPQNYTYLEYNMTRMGGGVICGYQIYIKKHLVIDLLAGYGALYSTDINIIKMVNIKMDNQPKTINDFRLSLNLGYKF